MITHFIAVIIAATITQAPPDVVGFANSAKECKAKVADMNEKHKEQLEAMGAKLACLRIE
jgi:hypothetical protein